MTRFMGAAESVKSAMYLRMIGLGGFLLIITTMIPNLHLVTNATQLKDQPNLIRRRRIACLVITPRASQN
jgi:hypothetical protein